MKQFIIALSSLLSLSSNCQVNLIDDIVDNNSIKFIVMKTSVDYINDSTFTSSSKIIYVTNFTRDHKNNLKTFAKEQWLSVLQNPEFDWAANLLLYELYRKDAMRFRNVKTREDWLKKYYLDDLKYWKAKL